MNTLCHLCLGMDDPEHMFGQFLGDFVRGPVQEQPYPEKVLRGIRAHRRVDAAGESHPVLKQIKTCLPADQRRYAGVLYDLYGDYLLYQCWDTILPQNRETVLSRVYDFLNSPPLPFPENARGYVHFLLTHRVIDLYADKHELPEIMDRVGQRLRRPVRFSPMLRALQKQEERFLKSFPGYYQDMKQESDRIWNQTDYFKS